MLTQLDKVKGAQALKRLNVLLDTGKLALEDQSQIRLFAIRYRQLPALIATLEDNYQKTMVSLTDAVDIDNELKLGAAVDMMHVEVVQLYEELFPASTDTSPANKSDLETSRHAQSGNVRLPKLELRHFDGDFQQWTTFIDFFNSCIHNNESLSNIDRFQYLLSSLSGEPLIIIKGYPLTDSNYVSAYNALVSRYQNKRRLAFTHWEAIREVAVDVRSSVGLRRMLDTFTENLIALENLDLPVKQWDFILFHTLLTKLDISMREAFERQNYTSKIPSFESLKNFVNVQCQAMELSRDGASGSHSASRVTKKIPQVEPLGRRQVRSALLVNTASVESCGVCRGEHRIFRCPEFREKSAQDRFEFVKGSSMCINCLQHGHRASNCTSVNRCQLCDGLHNTLLHFDQTSPSATKQRISTRSNGNSDQPVTVTAQIDNSQEHVFAAIGSTESKVLLSTVCVQIKDSQGRWQNFRALLDNASQANVLSDDCVRRLGLRSVPVSVPIHGLGQAQFTATAKVSCTVTGSVPSSPSINLDAYIVPKICGDMPASRVIPYHWPHIDNVMLADSTFHSPGPVDMLLGTEVFCQIILGGLLSGSHNEPVALNTKWGYILMGNVSSSPNPENLSRVVSAAQNMLSTVPCRGKKEKYRKSPLAVDIHSPLEKPHDYSRIMEPIEAHGMSFQSDQPLTSPPSTSTDNQVMKDPNAIHTLFTWPCTNYQRYM